MRLTKKKQWTIWKIIRSVLPKKSIVLHYTKNTETLANEFNRIFTSVGEKAARESAELARSDGLLDYDASHTSNTSESEQDEPTFTFDTVSCNHVDVLKVIMTMPSNKAPGYDRVPLFVIKDCLRIPHILPTLIGLINSSLLILFSRMLGRGP